MKTDSLEQLRGKLREFADEREWDQFHTPKNLCCALAVEAAELLEIFQWQPDLKAGELPDEVVAAAEQEIGDVLLYLIRLSDKLGVDPVRAANAKLAINAEKYPVALARGTSKKYTDL
jgi:NTP pyrophosphatase (non-canonical NTP hydrolase)